MCIAKPISKVIIFVLFCAALDTAEEVTIYIGLFGKLIAEYSNGKAASDETGVCQRNILQVCNKTEYSKGRCRKQAGGYIWKFKYETIHR